MKSARDAPSYPIVNSVDMAAPFHGAGLTLNRVQNESAALRSCPKVEALTGVNPVSSIRSLRAGRPVLALSSTEAPDCCAIALPYARVLGIGDERSGKCCPTPPHSCLRLGDAAAAEPFFSATRN